MEAITSIQSPISPMGALFETIDEHKEHQPKKRSVLTPVRSKQTVTTIKCDPSKHKNQSILSLSSIMAAFGNASFANLGSPFRSNTKHNSNNKPQSIDNKNEFLTLNIVGIRDNGKVTKNKSTTDTTNELETAAQTVDAMIAKLNQDETKTTDEIIIPEKTNEIKEEEINDDNKEQKSNEADTSVTTQNTEATVTTTVTIVPTNNTQLLAIDAINLSNTVPSEPEALESKSSSSAAPNLSISLTEESEVMSSSGPGLFGGDDSSSEEESSSELSLRRVRHSRPMTPLTPLPRSPVFGDDSSSDESKDESKDDIKENSCCLSDKTGNSNEKTEIGLCLKTIVTPLTRNSTVKEFKDYLKLSNVFDLDKHTIIQLLYSNIILDDEYRTLGYYGISNNSFVLAAILEGKPLNNKEYEKEIENLKLQMKNDAPAQYKTSQLNSGIVNRRNIGRNNGNGNRFAALTAFMRRHVQNVRNGENVTTVINNIKPVKIERPKILNFGQMADNFEIERMSCFDFMTLENDDNCIKMPCGHGINAEALLAYVLSEVDSKNTQQIHCPQLVKDDNGKEVPCKAAWHYPIIKKILMQSIGITNENKDENKENNEMKKSDLLNFMKIELLAARNILQEVFDVQKCGHCNTILFRQQSDLSKKLRDFQAVCSLCTVRNRHKHHERFISQNNEEIAVIREQIKELKKPKILKTINKYQSMMKSLTMNDIKTKFNNTFFETQDMKEIEKNSKKYNKSMSKYIRRSKKHRKAPKILSKNVLSVPSSFLNAFRTDSDYDSSDEEEDNEQKQSKILNPYLAEVSDDYYNSSEYEYVTTDNESETESEIEIETNITEIKEDTVTNNANNSANNGFVFDTNVNDNSSDDESSEAGPNLFASESDSESEDDEEETKEEKKNETVTTTTNVRVKSKEEIEIENLERKIMNIHNRKFDENKYNIIFCWGCGVTWKDVDSPACGNNECSTSFRSQILSILTDCDAKQIGSQAKVPTVRACPKCGQLINHWEACKHMQCRQCQTQFCFVCLKKYVKDKGWQCGSYGDRCPDGVKARQTCDDLPSMNVATLTLFEF